MLGQIPILSALIKLPSEEKNFGQCHVVLLTYFILNAIDIRSSGSSLGYTQCLRYEGKHRIMFSLG